MSVETNFEQNKLFKCVKNILDFYFGDVSFKTLSAFFTDEKTFDLAQAQNVLESFNLNVTQKKISADAIAKHFLPCIIFDKDENPLILVTKSEDAATIFDPESEKNTEIDLKELKLYTKALLIFKDTNHVEYLESSDTKSWFYKPLKSNYKAYIEIGIISLFINIFALAIPLFIMNIYNRVVPNQAYETLFVLASGTTIILIFDVILKYSRTHILDSISKKVGLFWEEELMSKIILVDVESDKHLSGSKANLFKELQQIRDFFTNRSLTQIIDFPFFLIAILVIYIISPIVAIVPLVFAVIIIAFNLLMQYPISKLTTNNSQNIQSKYSFIFESIQGAQSIKLNNAAPTRMFLWKNIIAYVDSVGMKIQSLHALSTNISQFFLQIVTVLVVIVGVFEISNQSLSVGGLIAVTMLASRAMVPIVSLSNIIVRLKEMNQSVDRIDEFMSLPTEENQKTEAGIGKINASMEFKNVTYSFHNAKHPSIDQVSFTINAGEKVAIIGQTGAGKTTLLKLLMGLYKPSSGSIYLDNHDITTIHPVEIRQNIGVMPQEPFLFNATIKENIELFRPISKVRMMEIITFIGLGDLIKKSGKGDALQVGERGSKLSVGQRHLVGLARALAPNPPILILDEPTTGLDMGSERRLIDRLKRGLKPEKTLLVITHRLAALDLVDRVIVMSDGKIVADGPKEKILNALQTPLKKEMS